MYPLTPFANQITRDFLFHLLLSRSFTDYAVHGSARAGMPKVNREHLFEYTFWLPPMARQGELAAWLDQLQAGTHQLSEIYERKQARLEALQAAILNKAFNGTI
jgi:type I restriction enzyme S subunit